MQTRRDQLHAYRFQNRRALAALVTGDPNVVEAPMRRLTITTVSGIMIAVLVTVGFTLFGLIRPKAGDAWKDAGSVIVEQGTGATYVYLDGTLHTVTNYTSAVLAAGNNAHTVNVEREDIADAKRGPQVGIPGLPGTLPDAGGLVSSPVTACSRLQPDTTGSSLQARVSVLLGDDADSTPIATTKGIVVNTGGTSQSYLLYEGHRLAIGNADVATALGIGSVPALQVGRAFLDAVPAGTDLTAPDLPRVGKPADIPGIDALVGQLLKVRGSDSQYFVALADGTAPVNPVERALLQTLPLSGNSTIDPVEVSLSDVLNRSSTKWNAIRSAQLSGLPSALPDGDSPVAAGGGICAVFDADSDTPRFAQPKTLLSANRPSTITESSVSEQGLADTVDVPPGRAALVRSADGARTTFLIGDTGKKFAAPNDEVLGLLKYKASDATVLPAQLLALVPAGPALVPDAARRTAS